MHRLARTVHSRREEIRTSNIHVQGEASVFAEALFQIVCRHHFGFALLALPSLVGTFLGGRIPTKIEGFMGVVCVLLTKPSDVSAVKIEEDDTCQGDGYDDT